MNNNTPPLKTYSLPKIPFKKVTSNSNPLLKNIGNAVLQKLTKKNVEKSSLENHLLNNYKVEQGNNYPRKKSSLINNSLFFSENNENKTDEKLTNRILDSDDFYSEEDEDKISEKKSSDKEEVKNENEEIEDNKNLIFGDKEDLRYLKFIEIMDLPDSKERSHSLSWTMCKSLFLGIGVYLITHTLKLEIIDSKTPKIASEPTMIFRDVFGPRTIPLFIGVLVGLLYLILSMNDRPGKRSKVNKN